MKSRFTIFRRGERRAGVTWSERSSWTLLVTILLVIAVKQQYSIGRTVLSSYGTQVSSISTDSTSGSLGASNALPNAFPSPLKSTVYGLPEREDLLQTVWVVSHRRSGTHMTMDVLAHAIGGNLRIVKAAHVEPLIGRLSCECLTYMQAHGKIIHAYRDIRDVLISNYFYRVQFDRKYKDLEFREYLLDRPPHRLLSSVIEGWSLVTTAWHAQSGVLHLDYDETVQGYPHTYRKIAQFLGVDVKNILLEPAGVKAVSDPVSRGFGMGPHGWTKVYTSTMGRRIMRYAQRYGLAHKDSILQCEPQTEWNMTHPRLVGRVHGFEIPQSCPKDFELMPVVMSSKVPPPMTTQANRGVQSDANMTAEQADDPEVLQMGEVEIA